MKAQGSELRAQSAGRRAQGAGRRAQSSWSKINIIRENMDDFRFEKLEIWKESIEVTDVLFDFAEKADEKRFYKFAEQLRAAAMSISNNIAEGSGSFSDREFASFLNISRRSVFECANILFIFERRKVITSEERIHQRIKLLILSKQITNFRKSLV